MWSIRWLCWEMVGKRCYKCEFVWSVSILFLINHSLGNVSCSILSTWLPRLAFLARPTSVSTSTAVLALVLDNTVNSVTVFGGVYIFILFFKHLLLLVFFVVSHVCIAVKFCLEPLARNVFCRCACTEALYMVEGGWGGDHCEHHIIKVDARLGWQQYLASTMQAAVVACGPNMAK